MAKGTARSRLACLALYHSMIFQAKRKQLPPPAAPQLTFRSVIF